MSSPSISAASTDDAPFAFPRPRVEEERPRPLHRETVREPAREPVRDRPRRSRAGDRPVAAPPLDTPEGGIEALRIIAYTAFGIIGTAMGYVFFPPAGLIIALIVAFKGFERVYGSYRSPGLRGLSLLCFTGFAIVATAMGFVMFPPAGLVLALVFLWKGFGQARAAAAPVAPETVPSPTGNAAFDAYRDQTLQRLKDEQSDFEAFLDRLRRAKDKSEFDRFMEDRESAGRTSPSA